MCPPGSLHAITCKKEFKLCFHSSVFLYAINTTVGFKNLQHSMKIYVRKKGNFW